MKMIDIDESYINQAADTLWNYNETELIEKFNDIVLVGKAYYNTSFGQKKALEYVFKRAFDIGFRCQENLKGILS